MLLKIKLFLLLIFTIPLFGQLNLAVSVGSEYYAKTEFNFSSKFGVHSFYTSENVGSYGMRLVFNQTSFDFRSPTGTKKVRTFISDYFFVYGYAIVKDYNSFQVEPQIGMGVKIIQKESYQISLGAHGEKIIPKARKDHTEIVSGISISYKTGSDIYFFVRPEVVIYDLEKIKYIYALNGGIAVAFK